MAVTSKIRKQGGAAVLTIPPALLGMLEAEIGTAVELSVADGALTVRPTVRGPRRRYTLAELLEGAEAAADLVADTAWAREGGPVGREVA